jgi:hypothetical protein
MELEEKQLKNIRNKLVDFMYKTTPTMLIRVAVLCGFKVPRELYEKYMSELNK